MVGRSRKNDVKSRLGKRNLTTAKPKTGRIRDARDVLKQKGSAKVEISVDISCFALVNLCWQCCQCKTLLYAGNVKRCYIVINNNKCFVVSYSIQLGSSAKQRKS